MPKKDTKKKTIKKKGRKTAKKTPVKKKAVKKKPEKKKKEQKKPAPKKLKYIESIGRRKTSIARVRFYRTTKEKGVFLVNKKDVKDYFKELELINTVEAPIQKTDGKILKRGKIEILLKGGGRRGQADAAQLGIARIILEDNPKLKTIIKSHGFLTRDPRKKERKKFGLKKARKAPQWQKR